jgi:hypothetical protein
LALHDLRDHSDQETTHGHAAEAATVETRRVIEQWVLSGPGDALWACGNADLSVGSKIKLVSRS